MGRHVQHVRIVVEDVLGAVAVVHVPIDDRHALPGCCELRRSDRDVVEEAEAHRPVGHGMVSRRAARRKGDVTRSGLERVDGVEHGTGGPQRGGPRPGRRVRVGIEIAPASLAEAFELRHVARGVHTLEIVDGRQPGFAELDRIEQPGFGDAGE